MPLKNAEMQSRIKAAHQAVDRSFPKHLESCRTFLRQPSVSATGEGIRETAHMVGDRIQALGGRVELAGSLEFPLVYGRIDAGAERTLIIYGMYDVQPAEEKGWKSPPFAAEIRKLPGLGECVVARGAVNSKGALAGMFNALDVMKETGGLPLNLIFTIEGEEEIGSPNFDRFIRERRRELMADGMIEFDFSQGLGGLVTMHLGLKGIVYLNLICRRGKSGGPVDTAEHGSVSAWISSPVWRLIHALSLLTDRRENIRIPGLASRVAPLSRTDSRLLKILADRFDEQAFLKEMRSLGFKHDLHGYELLKKGLYWPVVNINGFHAGYGGPGSKTILPRKATAKVDIRFGPNLEPEEVIENFREFLNVNGFDDIEITVLDSYSWSKTGYLEPLVQKMIKAYQVHGQDPEVWPMATWGAPYFAFSRTLGLPVVSGGLGHGGRQHAANEYMTVAGLRDMEKFAVTFLHLAAQAPPSSTGPE